MANTLSKAGIETSNTVEAWHVTQSIDALTGIKAYDITISGSLTLQDGTEGTNKIATSDTNGTISFTSNITASLYGTASWSQNSISSSYVPTSSYALNTISASYSTTSTSASYALNSTSASYAPNIFNSDGIITSNRTASLGSNALLFDGTNSDVRYTPNNAGGYLQLEGKASGVPRFAVSIPTYSPLSKSTAGFQLGMRAWDDATYTGYGKIGDAFFYAGNETNGFNFLNPVGTGTEDYIRFYAGQLATSTADIHIQGSGSTRGYVGIGKETPNTKLDVNGDITITGSLIVSNETLFTSTKSFSTGGGTLDASDATRISLRIDGTTTTILSDGNDGQIIYLYCTQQISAGSHTITPSNAAGFTSIEFSKVGHTAVIMFMTNKWYLFSSYGVTISS